MRTIILALSLGSCLQAIAQNGSMQYNYGVKLYSGKTVVHTPSVKNIADAKPFGVEIEVAKHRTDFASYNISSAYVKTGWALSYFNYNLPLLGYGVIASRFIEPQYRIFKKLQFGVRASAGIAYLSNPNDADKNPENNNYALHINPYLHLGTSLNLQVSKHISAGLQSNFHHISNGNLQQPNKGINWITAALSLNYYPGNNTLPKYKRVHQNFWKKNKAVIQAGIFYTPRQGYFAKWMAQRKYAAGVFTQITKQIGGVSALTAGTEIYYNNFKQDANTAPLKSGIVAGIHGGHVFLLGKVHFSQQAGFNIYNKIYFLPDFYHRWGLDYSINKKYTIGASLKANSDNADFFDFRMSLRL